MRRQAGLTMIELIVFIVIISVAVAAVMETFSKISARSADPFLRKQAMLRAESLLEEVSLAHFTFCHPDDANAETAASAAGCAGAAETAGHPAGETRPYFNVNDYVATYGVPASFTAGDTSGKVVTDVTGALMLPAGFSALVTVTPVAAFGPPSPLEIGAGGEVLHILVDVGYGENQHVVLERYRTRYAPNSMP